MEGDACPCLTDYTSANARIITTEMCVKTLIRVEVHLVATKATATALNKAYSK